MMLARRERKVPNGGVREDDGGFEVNDGRGRGAGSGTNDSRDLAWMVMDKLTLTREEAIARLVMCDRKYPETVVAAVNAGGLWLKMFLGAFWKFSSEGDGSDEHEEESEGDEGTADEGCKEEEDEEEEEEEKADELSSSEAESHETNVLADASTAANELSVSAAAYRMLRGPRSRSF